MTAIASGNQLLNILTGGEGATWTLDVLMDGRVGATVPTMSTYTERSTWTWNKSPGSAGVAPTTAANPTRNTTGAIVQRNPGGGRQSWLVSAFFGIVNTTGMVVVYDRLAHCGGLSGTVTTAQTITGLSVNRYTGAESDGNQILLEIYTQIGATSTTVTASYTNQDGTAGRTTKPMPIGNTNWREAMRVIRLPLQNGDTGVRSVESVTLAASTGTAGDFGVTIIRPLATLMAAYGGCGAVVDCFNHHPIDVEIKTDACLSVLVTAVRSNIEIMLNVCEA